MTKKLSSVQEFWGPQNRKAPAAAGAAGEVRSTQQLMKYADDTSVLVPEHTECQLDEEFGRIESWASKNKTDY